MTEMTTVSTITVRPSQIERRSAEPMSMTPIPSHRLLNQCSDRPFSGKVRPPCGPWKERTRMVSIGP